MIFNIICLSALGLIQLPLEALAGGRKYRSLGRVERSENSFRCPAEGFHPDARDCHLFYRCVDMRSNDFFRDYTEPKLVPFTFECGPGTVFDPDYNICNHPRETRRAECGGKQPNGESNGYQPPYEENQGLYPEQYPYQYREQYPDQYPQQGQYPDSQGGYAQYPSNGNMPQPTYPIEVPNEMENQVMPGSGPSSSECQSEGFYPVQGNCKKFIRCVNNGNGYTKHEFSCGPGTVWDPANLVCNYPSAVPGCGGPEENQQGNGGYSESGNQPDQGSYPDGYPGPGEQAGQGSQPGEESYPWGYPGEQPGNPGLGGGQPGQGEYPGPGGYPELGQPGQGGYPRPGGQPGQPGQEGYPNRKPGQGGQPGQPGQEGYPNRKPGQDLHPRPSGQPGQSGYPSPGGQPELGSGEQPVQPGHEGGKPGQGSQSGDCSAEGFSGVQGNCKKFIRCVNNGMGGYTKFEFECGEGTAWDSNLNTCNYAHQVKGCENSNTGDASGLGNIPERPEQEGQPQKPGQTGGYPGPGEQPGRPGQGGYPRPGGPPQKPGPGGYPSGKPGRYPGPQPGQLGQGGHPRPGKQPGQPGQGGYPRPGEQPGQPGQGGYPRPGEQPGQPGQGGYPRPGGQSQQPGLGGYPGPGQQPGQFGGYPEPNEQPEQHGQPGQKIPKNPNPDSMNPVTGNPNECQTEGFHPVKGNCKKFYRCVDNGKNGFRRYDFQCGEGTVWDQDNEACNHPWAVARSDADCMSPDNQPSSSTDPTRTTSADTLTTTNNTNQSQSATTSSMSSQTSSTSSSSSSTSSTSSTTSTSSMSTTSSTSSTSSMSSTSSQNQTASTSGSQNQSLTTQGSQTTSSQQSGMTTAGSNQTTVTKPKGEGYTKPMTPQQQSSTTTPSSPLASSTEDPSKPPPGSSPCDQKKPQSPIKCEKAGFYPDPSDCKKFYRCVDWDDGKGERFSVYFFECGPGTIWDPTLETCNHEKSVYPPRDCSASQKPIEESTTSSQPNQMSSTTPTKTSTTTAKPKPTTKPTTTKSSSPTTASTTQMSTTPNTEATENPEQTESTSSATDSTQQTTDSSTPSSTDAMTSTDGTEPSSESTSDTSIENTSPMTTGESETSTPEQTDATMSQTDSTTATSDSTSRPTDSVTETTFSSTGQTDSNETPSMGTTEPSQPENPNCPELEEGQSAFVCPTGFRRHPKDCNMFYQCTTSKDSGDINVMVLSCKNNTVYDERKIQCLPPEETESCPNQGRRFYRRVEDELSSTVVYVSPNKRLCPKEGSFPYEEDCTMFYKCKKNRSGKIQGYLYQCPENYSFWAGSNQCERSSKLPKCTRSIPEVTSKNFKWIKSKVPTEYFNIGTL